MNLLVGRTSARITRTTRTTGLRNGAGHKLQVMGETTEMLPIRSRILGGLHTATGTTPQKHRVCAAENWERKRTASWRIPNGSPITKSHWSPVDVVILQISHLMYATECRFLQWKVELGWCQMLIDLMHPHGLATLQEPTSKPLNPARLRVSIEKPQSQTNVYHGFFPQFKLSWRWPYRETFQTKSNGYHTEPHP